MAKKHEEDEVGAEVNVAEKVMETAMAPRMGATLIPNVAGVAIVDEGPRCINCGRMFAIRLTRPWIVDCPRCHARNRQD